MSNTLLIFGGTKENRNEKVAELTKLAELKETPDIKIVKPIEDEKSIKLDAVKDGIKFLQNKPFASLEKFLIILDAEKMTEEAQNSLLKILEEPPEYATTILSTKTENSLLETVLSRCKKIPLKNISNSNRVGDAENDICFEKILNMTIGERFEVAEEESKKEREEVIETFEKWIEEERERMLKNETTNCTINAAKNIKLINSHKEDLESSNVNLRWSIETLLLNIEK